MVPGQPAFNLLVEQTMDLLAQYDDEEEQNVTSTIVNTTPAVTGAPNVVISDSRISNSQLVNPHATQLHYNAKVTELYGPIVGPENPHRGVNTLHEGIGGTGVNSNLTGYVESYHINKYMFDRNFYQEDSRPSNEVCLKINVLLIIKNTGTKTKQIKKKESRSVPRTLGKIRNRRYK